MELLRVTIMFYAVMFAMVALNNIAYASDPANLQDFCVGVNDPHSAIVNGLLCKDPTKVNSEDFAYRGFNTLGDTNNKLGIAIQMINVTILPSINTLGVSMARIDFAPKGVNSPHYHPRASEMLTVIDGSLYAGFVTTNLRNGSNKLYSTVLNKGDIFVFPQGLIHFQINLGETRAVANVAFGSQNPGVVTVARALFDSDPRVSVDLLSKAFSVDKKLIEYIESRFS
ncbi:hypothetical protein vseg_013896 [Gypsophila vaccaria]